MASHHGVVLVATQVAAIQKGVASKATDWEESRKHYKEQLEMKDAHIKRLEETVQVRCTGLTTGHSQIWPTLLIDKYTLCCFGQMCACSTSLQRGYA